MFKFVKSSALAILVASFWGQVTAQVSGTPVMKDIGTEFPVQTGKTLSGEEWTNKHPGKVQLIQFVVAGHDVSDTAMKAVDEYVWERLKEDPTVELSTIFLQSDIEKSRLHHERLELSYDVIPDDQNSFLKANFRTPRVEIPYFVVLDQEGKTAFVSSGFRAGQEAELFQAVTSVRDGDEQTISQLLEIHALKKILGDVLGEQMPAIEVEKWITEGSAEANGKYQLVEFWATWCGPCHRVVPELKKLHQERSDEIQIISMTYEDPALVENYVKKKKIEYPIAVDTKRRLQSALAVNAFPTGFLVNPEGEIIWYGNMLELLLFDDEALDQLIEADKAKRLEGTTDT